MKINIVEAINLALKQEIKKDRTVMVLGEDVGVDGGVFRATDGLLKLYGSNRVVDTPLAESGIVGTSIGLAMNGFKPVAEIQFSGFIYPAFDQLISHASRIRNRTRGRYTCPMVVRTPYSGGIRALEHHSESMEAIYVHTPGLKVVIPATPYDAKGLLVSSIRDPDPVIFYEPKRIYRAIKEEVPEKDFSIPLGKAKVLQSGNDVTLIAWGAMVRECKTASDKSGYDCEILDLRTLSPMDTEAIVKSVKKTGRAVIVHEAPRSAGVGAEVSSRIMENVLLDLKAPVVRVTGFDTVVPLFKMEKSYLPDTKRILSGIENVMKF